MMIDRIKKVNNPLTIIAIFAGLAEVAGTIALGIVDKSLQSTFVWFVMGFPVVLVLFFFLTLNFNPSVLYAPSDFENEEFFYKMIAGKHKLDEEFQNIIDLINKSKDEITKEAVSKAKISAQNGQEKIEELINSRFEKIENALLETKNSAVEIAIPFDLNNLPNSELQSRIIECLANNPDSNLRLLSNSLNMTQYSIRLALRKLEQKGLVVSTNKGRSSTYRLQDCYGKIC